MKVRSTTPTIKRLFVSACLLTGVAAMALTAPIQAYGASYQQQINELENKVSSYKAKAEQLSKKADSLENAIASFNQQIASIEASIKVSQTKRAQLEDKIAKNKEAIKLNKKVFADIVGDMYVDGMPSSVEILASSKSIGDYVNKQSYRDSLNSQLNESVVQISQLQKKLKQQKQEVQDTLKKQKSKQVNLSNKRAERDHLLDVTKGKEAEYQSLVKSTKAKIAETRAELRRSLQTRSYRVAGNGQQVNAGAVIGTVGSTGMSTGPHTHVEVRVGNSPVNPSSYMQSNPVPGGYVSQGYNAYNCWYAGCTHAGVDYAAGFGTPIHAIASGTLYRYWGAYGCMALIEHGSGVISIYGHMQPKNC